MAGRYADRGSRPVSPGVWPCPAPLLVSASRLLKQHLSSLPGRLQWGLVLWVKGTFPVHNGCQDSVAAALETHGGFETLGGPAGQSGGRGHQGQRADGPRQLMGDPALKGRVVTLDALGCQTDIVRTLSGIGGGYLLAVKGNQPHLHDALQRDFAYLDRTGSAPAAHDRSEILERRHGWHERRTCTIMSGVNGL